MFGDSSTTIIYNIVNVMGWIAGIACVGMIVLAIIKIITGDESDAKLYLRRIKNGIVAFILIFSVTTVTRLIVNSYIGTSEANIGDFGEHAIAIGKADSNTRDTSKDLQNRQIINYNGQKLVRTDVDHEIKEGTFFHKIKMKVDIYRDFNDSQGATKGWSSQKLYYVYKSSDDLGDLDGKSKYFIFPVSQADEIDGSKESWENILAGYDYNQLTDLAFTVITDKNGNILETPSTSKGAYNDTDPNK